MGYTLWDAIFRTRSFHKNEKRIRKSTEEILDILALRHFAKERPKNLPYGIQRRVEIGRALSIRPKLLLLDEPAAGMNPSEVEQLIELIRWIRDEFKLTIWLIEHHMRVVMNVCEWIKVIDFGETIAEGVSQEIQQNSRVIQAYLGEEE
jgi:branched-chain amino acid transport system ATP-binding protein